MNKILKHIGLALSLYLCQYASAQSITLSLEDCKNAALSSNAYSRNAALDVKSAELQKQEALWEYFPRVNATAFSYYSLYPLLDIGVTDILGDNELAWNIQNQIEAYAGMFGVSTHYTAFKSGYTAGLTLMQPVFAGGRIVNGNRLASVGVTAARLQASMQNRKTVSEIEDIWWDMCCLEEKISTLQELETAVNKLYSQLENAIGAGLASETDLLRMEVKRGELKAGRKKAEKAEKLLKINLLNSIGLDYAVDSVSFATSVPLPEAPELYYSETEKIVSDMEESQLLQMQVEARKLEKDMAIGEALPQIGIGLSSGYSNLYGNTGRFNTLAVATIQVPISDWGKTSKKAHRLELQKQKAENEQEFLEKQLHLQVEKYWLDLTSSYDEWQVSLENRKAVEKLYRLAMSHFDSGLLSATDMIQAQTDYLKAVSEESDALTAYRKAIIAYTSLNKR